MFWAVVSWGIRPVFLPVYWLSWGRHATCLVHCGGIGTCSRAHGRPGEQVRGLVRVSSPPSG